MSLKMNRYLSLHPLTYFAATSGAVLVCYGIFYWMHTGARYYFLPAIVLALVYASINFTRQLRGNSEFKIVAPTNLALFMRRVLVRYVAWLIIMLVGFRTFEALPYFQYERYAINVGIYQDLIDAYLILGIPYFVLTLWMRAARSEDFYDPVVRLILMIRQPFFRLLKGESLHRILRAYTKRYNRKVLLSLLLRAYFIPPMLIQVPGFMSQVIEKTGYAFIGQDMLSLLLWTISLLWLLDATNATVAYLIESRWLENRARSIDMTVIGWIVCVSCYEPLNIVPGSLMPFGYALAGINVDSLILPTLGFLLVAKLIESILLGVHIFIDVSLGPSVANISLRKIQTRGAYALVRHPGTTTKLLFWFTIPAFYAQFWTAPFLLGYLGWAALYITRALTEERHLRQYAEYREYMAKVRYRFIPGLI